MWVFAYGSLIFRPSFPFLERRRAFVDGFARRFWQSSPDHRGVPEAPGLVVTLVPSRGEVCGGCAYRLDPASGERVFAELDVREQAGFERHVVPLLDGPSGAAFSEGTAYVAVPTNLHFAGPLDETAIAARVRRSRGPSGTNHDYVVRLHESLRGLGIHDEHVEKVVRLLEPNENALTDG